MSKTRRSVLKRGGASIAALSGLAGCLGGGGSTPTDAPDEASGGGDGGDGDGSANTATPTATADPTATGTATATPVADQSATPAGDLRKWMPEPGVIDQAGYAFLGMAPKALEGFESDLGSGAVSSFDQSFPISGVGIYGEQRALYRFARTVSVVVGEFDRTTVEDGLRDLGFEAGEAYRGFRLFTASNPRAAAVRDGMLVLAGSFGSTGGDKTPLVEAVVDARTGNGPRYVEAVGDCDRLLAEIGSAHVLQGRTHETGTTFEHGVGEGMGYHVASDRTRVHAAALFTEGHANRSGMADWARKSEALLGGEPTIRTDGRAVTATTFVPTGDVTEFPGGYPGPSTNAQGGGAPQVNFAFEYESTGDGRGHCTVTHEGGDAVDRKALSIRGSGFADVDGVDQTAAGTWQGSASGDGGAVVAGDSVAVGVTSDCELDVVWSGEGSSTTLATFAGPDA